MFWVSRTSARDDDVNSKSLRVIGRFLAFGMPETPLSRLRKVKKCRKQRQLDMLVFGMPKIYEG
jgi:hypothetical protein